MADEYRDLTGGRVTVNYQSIGSGGGIRQFTEQTVMFGMTEAFLNDGQLAAIAAAGGGIAFNLPITLGDVVPPTTCPASRRAWSSTATRSPRSSSATSPPGPTRRSRAEPGRPPAAAADHRRAPLRRLRHHQHLHELPDQGVARVGERVGFATSVNWPVGIGGNGNEGVAGVVQNTPGAIGYNSLVYAVLNGIAYGYVENKSGNVIEPSLAATSLAADVPLPADTRILVTDTEAPDGYPIAGFAWMLLYENLDANNAISTRAQAEELLKFVLWAITDGQDLSEPLSFSRIPAAVLQLNLDMIRQMKWQGEDLGAQVLAAAGY
jgi:phosphate transport system substrate-binding protein